MMRALGALVLAMLALSACAPLESLERELFPPEDAAAGDTQAVPLASQPSAVPPLPRRKPAAVSDPPEAISALTPAEADPERLVGLDFDAAKALLGEPAATHEEPPAEVWAYQGGICSFNLFFYPSVDDKVFRVLAYQVTDEAGALGLRWLRDPPDAVPDAVPEAPPQEPPQAAARVPKVLDKDDSVVRRCFAELLHNQQIPNAG